MGRRLCAARIEAGYKAAEFARLLGRTPRMLQRYESGATPPPLDVLQRWAEVTEKSIDYFVSPKREDDPPPAPELLTHPGVEALAADSRLRDSLQVTEVELKWLRSQWWDDRPPMQTTDDALSLLLSRRRMSTG